MMKKKVDSSGLYTIENKKRPRVIKKRSGKTAFKAKYHRRRTQVIAMFSCLAILAVGILAIGSIFDKADPNVVDPGFVTVSYNPPSDGSLPTDHSALENIGYMNKRFSEQTKWYSEMHGTTVANTMGINVAQSVNTYKQFDNQTLIMADITTSSMVNKARQFCYQGDEVLWRMGSGSSTAWATGSMGDDCFDKLLTMQWKEGEPYGHMSLAAFTEKNGLPGTGFSVYVINEETLLSANEVIDNGDGTYSQTYYLDPAVDKAPCHYVNQMVFTGDLPSLPTFNYITVTYTFDESWRILRSIIDEQYTAVMGVSATCTSAYQTDFEYGTQRAESTAYQEYFKDYIGSPFTEPNVKAEISSLNCLTSAFASVLTEPVTFDLSLNVNGSALSGKVYVDVGTLSLDTMDIRAQIGSLKLWLSNGTAFVEYGGVKARLTVSELIGFIGELTGQTEGGFSLDTDALLGALADGEFVYDESSATLSSTLSLGIDIPVVFHFLLDEEGNVSLGNVIANISFNDLTVGASLQFGEGGLQALSAQEQAQFVDLLPLARDAVSILKSDVLAIELDYAGEGYRIEGRFDFAVLDLAKLDFRAQGSLCVTVGAAQKRVGLIYENGALYLECDGMKIKADLNEGIAFVKEYLLPKTQLAEGTAQQAAFDLGNLLQTVLSDEFAALLALDKTQNGAEVLIKGTEVLEALGVRFDLGDVRLSLGGGSLGVSALGLQVTLTESKNTIVAPDGSEYADILPYVQAVIGLIKSEAIDVDLAYRANGLALEGSVQVSLSRLTAQGYAVLRYTDAKNVTIEKTLQFAYIYAEGGGTLYLGVDGLKISAQANEIVSALMHVLGMEMPEFALAQEGESSILATLEKVLALDFATLLNVREENDTLSVVVYGSNLLSALGFAYELGDITLDVGKTGTVTVGAMGASLTLASGSYTQPDIEDYVDITPVLAAIPDIFEAKSLGFAGAFTLTVNTTALAVEIKHATIGFANGLNVYAELGVTIGGTQIGIVLNITQEDIAFIVDGLAARVRFSEFNDLASAVSDLYRQIATAINGMIVTGEEDGILADTIEGLMKKLGVADMLSNAAGSFDLSLINQLVIGAPESENGICMLVFGSLKVELTKGTQGNYLAATLSFADETFALQGGLTVYAAEAARMPEGNYLGMTDFLELLDYASAAVNTLTANNLSVTFEHGTIATVETENSVETVKTYDVSGTVDYYSGGSYPFVIDTQQQTVIVNVDLYAHVVLNYLDRENGNNFFLALDILDYDQNDVLDFFVTLSRFEASDPNYQPLKLYASADELISILASGCAMLGINYNLVNNYLVNKWLDVDTQAQLRALGSSLLRSFGVEDIFGVLAGGSATAEEGEQPETQGNFIRNIVIGKTQFVLQLADLTVQIGKTTVIEDGAARSYLTGAGYLSGNAYVDVTIDALHAVTVPTVTLGEEYFKLEGIARLLKMLTASATHRVTDNAISGEEQPAEYALNEFFYIDGTVTANLNVMGIFSKEVKIKLVAISVTVAKDGEVSINVRLEYDGVNVASIVAINGDTVVDLTLKNGMVYIKRVQSTYFDGSTEKAYPSPVTVYRVMPLANLSGDIVNQAAFLLNLGSVITKNLPSGDEGSTETPQEEVVDYGALFFRYIGSCVYAPNANGTCDYTLVIKGSALADIMDDIVIGMRSRFMDDGKEVLHELNVSTGIQYSVLDIDINAALVYENPCGIPVEDKTFDVAADVANAMEKALDEAKRSEWVGIPYIEGQTTVVSYVLAGETVGTQNVLFNSKTGECYANLVAPDTTDYEHRGYDIEWDFADTYREADGKYYIGANQIVYGSYQPKVYRLTLVGEDGWTAELDYIYGSDLLAAINNAYATVDKSAVSCSLTLEAIVNGETEGYVVWESHDYAVNYYDLNGALFATQYYKSGSPLAYPSTNPTRVGYVLDGWQNAAGERVEIGSAIRSNTELYPVWVLDESTEITVRLYSDLRYADAAFDPEQDGYYTEVTFNEQTGYGLSDLQTEGYQQMGWWYRGEDGAWSRVTGVTGLNGATLWAVWIQNIKVTVTNFAKKSSTYTIEGKVEGGSVYGKKSKEIYVAAGMTEDTVGTYTIIRKNGQSRDDLKYGAKVTIQYGEDGIGTFSESGMTSFNALFWTVGYGGIKITKTFNYGNGLSVSTESASYVSLDTYTVNFVDEDGNLIKSVGNVRLDCPYDDYDNNVYLDELAASEGIAVPEKEGFTGSWQHVAVTGNLTVKPVYVSRG